MEQFNADCEPEKVEAASRLKTQEQEQPTGPELGHNST